MSRNGSGTYSLPAGNPVVTGTTISSTTHNNTMSDVATALTDSLAKDGQTSPTANLPMATYKHTGVGNASARDQYAAAGQVQDQGLVWCSTAGGSANAFTLSPSPAITSYTAGQRFAFLAVGTSSSTVTCAVSALAAKAVQASGSALSSGEIVSGKLYSIVYDGTQFQLETVSVTPFIATLLNDANAAAALTTLGAAGLSGGNTFTALEPVDFTYADNGAAAGPLVDIRRTSASPAASDYLGQLRFYGNDSGANDTAYASLLAQITDPSDGSEDGSLFLRTMVAGTETNTMSLATGVQVGAPTGGDKGSGTLNAASGVYDNGTRIGTASAGASLALVSTQTATASTSLSFNISAGNHYVMKWRLTRSAASSIVLRCNSDTNVRYWASPVGIGSYIQTEGSSLANDRIMGTANFTTEQGDDNYLSLDFSVIAGPAGSATPTTSSTGFGRYGGVAAVTSIQILPASGTMTGEVSLWRYITA